MKGELDYSQDEIETAQEVLQPEEEINLIRYFQNNIRIYDTDGKRMNVLQFDVDRF